jgi:hypothetical protein
MGNFSGPQEMNELWKTAQTEMTGGSFTYTITIFSWFYTTMKQGLSL